MYNDTFLVSISPHTSHSLQPLSLTFCGPLTAACSRKCHLPWNDVHMKKSLTKSLLYFSTKPISHFLQRSKKYPPSNLQVFFLCVQKWSMKLILKRITRSLKWIKRDATAKVVKIRAWQQWNLAWFLQNQKFYAFCPCHKLRLFQV